MKQIQVTFKSLSIIALAVIAVGCASNLRDKENLAAAAGFQRITPSSPEQEATLKSLPAGRVSPVTYEGKQYFVLPDAANNQAWVGGPNQYQSFQRLRLERQISNNNLQAAQMNQLASVNWGSWGGWGRGGRWGW